MPSAKTLFNRGASMSKQPRPDFDTKIITPVFRLSFPNIWVARPNELKNGELQYSIVMLFDKKAAATELKAMKELAGKVATFRFGANTKGLRSPFRDGDTDTNRAGDLRKDNNPVISGMIYINAWSKNKPGVVNAKAEIIMDQDEVYGGCYCKAQLNCYAYDTAGNRGVSFGLLHVQKIKDGDPFGNRSRPEDAFGPVAGSEEETATAESMFS